MRGIVKSIGPALKRLYSRDFHAPPLGKLSAVISLLGLAILCYLLGAAAMYFRLPTSAYLGKAFQGAWAWTREQKTPDPVLPTAPAQDAILVDRPDKTDDGFTLYTTSAGSWAALIDMGGTTVHRWQFPFSQVRDLMRRDDPAVLDMQVSWFGCHLYPNGDLLAVCHADSQMPLGYGLIKLDKDSKLLWAYGGRVHHTVDVGDDGKIYALTQQKTSMKPARMDYLRVPYVTDSVVILAPDGKEAASIPIMEALRDSPYAAMQQSMIFHYKAPDCDYTHANSVMVLPNAMAARFPMFKPGQVLVSLRSMHTLAVLDVPGRSVAWAAQGSWRKQHSAEFLANGHLLLFDNLGGDGESRVLEYDPVNQALPWTYSSEQVFAIVERGAVQRLANGNTLIVDPLKCRLFEVTPAKETVWEAICVEAFAYAREQGTFAPQINVARRYRAEQLTFLEQGCRPRK